MPDPATADRGGLPAAVPAYLLAGGQSRRFGSDKARAELDGVPLLVRLARELQPLTASVTVIAHTRDAYADLGLTTIADIQPGRGPLAGLHAALHHAEHPWLLLASCDMLQCRPHWLAALAATRTAPAPATIQAVAFRERYWHPFPGLYHRSLLPEVERRLAAGELRMQHLLTDVATAAPMPPDWPEVAQANTPEDLAHAAAKHSSV
ncbi:MAG: molybdenum cofactor guanylyltransferase [Phycisphaeraceae bacterium]